MMKENKRKQLDSADRDDYIELVELIKNQSKEVKAKIYYMIKGMELLRQSY